MTVPLESVIGPEDCRVTYLRRGASSAMDCVGGDAGVIQSDRGRSGSVMGPPR